MKMKVRRPIQDHQVFQKRNLLSRITRWQTVTLSMECRAPQEVLLLVRLDADPCNVQEKKLFTIVKNTISLLRTQMIKVKTVHS